MGKTPKGDKKRPAPPAAEEEVGAVGDGAEANGGEAQPQPSTSGRKYTLSLAVPSSIVDHAHSLEAAAHVVGQVARAAAAFFADEVVVFDDSRQAANGDGTVSGAAAFMARVLQYLDTPPLLRPTLLDSHPDHAAAAHLPPLQCPHHPRDAADWWEYREGVVLKSEQGEGSFVEAGLDRNVWVQQALPPRTRVTMHLGSKPATRFVPAFSETMIVGKVGWCLSASRGACWVVGVRPCGGGAGVGFGAGRQYHLCVYPLPPWHTASHAAACCLLYGSLLHVLMLF